MWRGVTRCPLGQAQEIKNKDTTTYNARQPSQLGVQISSCLTLLLHTKYKHAVHQAATGSAHMICIDKTLKVLFCNASQRSLPALADFTKVLVDSCSIGGPCSSIVFCDNLRFRIICINAKTSIIDLVDAFGRGFPTEVRRQVQNFYNKHDGKGKWMYKTWSHTMQTDDCNCRTWSIWVTEEWMRYWNQGSTQKHLKTSAKDMQPGSQARGSGYTIKVYSRRVVGNLQMAPLCWT